MQERCRIRNEAQGAALANNVDTTRTRKRAALHWEKPPQRGFLCNAEHKGAIDSMLYNRTMVQYGGYEPALMI